MAINCGDTIVTKIGKIEAIVTAITIRFNARAYEVSYFWNGEYKIAWINKNEFDIKQNDQQIGFNQ